MCFGHGYADFLVDSPTAVAQCVYTRLLLWQDEWFLDLRDGTPWLQQILQHPPSRIPDVAIRSRIQGTPFVTSMVDYSSTFEPTTRNFTVSCKLYTQFGEVNVAPEGALISPSGLLVMPLTGPPPRPPPGTALPHAELGTPLRALPRPEGLLPSPED